MIRCSRVRRILGQNNGFRQHSDRESERINNERRRRIVYDSHGNLQLAGLAYMIWEDFHKPFFVLCGALGAFYGYHKLVASLSAGEDVRTADIDRQSERQARESGKLKADRFLVKPSRQIDDPDFLQIPSHSGKGEFKSKLFGDDDASSNPLYAGKNRSH